MSRYITPKITHEPGRQPHSIIWTSTSPPAMIYGLVQTCKFVPSLLLPLPSTNIQALQMCQCHHEVTGSPLVVLPNMTHQQVEMDVCSAKCLFSVLAWHLSWERPNGLIAVQVWWFIQHLLEVEMPDTSPQGFHISEVFQWNVPVAEGHDVCLFHNSS